MPTDDSKENRLRRTAARRGLRLEKCRRRDRLAIGFGTYQLVRVDNSSGNWRAQEVVASGHPDGYGLTLDQVEKALNE